MPEQTYPHGDDPPGEEGGRRQARERRAAAEAAATAGDPPVNGNAYSVPVTSPDEDWMAQARREAEADTWEPGRSPTEDQPGQDLASSASLVRPYSRTGGRTKPVRDLDLEALVRTTVGGKEASTGPWLNPEHMTIIDLCTGTVSVAEVAARLVVPIGVARVIIADMVDLGLIEVMKTSAADGDERDPAFLRRVLSGLQRL